MSELVALEFDVTQVLFPGGLEAESKRVTALAEQALADGRTVLVYTIRKRFDKQNADGEEQLQMAVEISQAVTAVIAGLTVQPSFIVAKGGITSSDVGVKALKVRRALVMGQILPGIPVWKTDEWSKFPGMPYVIFPGNVGDENALLNVVKMLSRDDGSQH